ncbi:hypothetical protein MIMGU_mgv1a016710mg [Erythranthe guttata]|uniref:Uncharacterized protein n=1 Tax=Erythranthe guttata TaxID=4155 RepID=A0A022RAC1_ERYGU|nr:hypothetical protein MIMGU_mgv1a016710mg [Erythranthe guttata]
MKLCRRLRFPAQSQFPFVLVQDSPAAATRPPEQAQQPKSLSDLEPRNPKSQRTKSLNKSNARSTQPNTQTLTKSRISHEEEILEQGEKQVEFSWSLFSHEEEVYLIAPKN